MGRNRKIWISFGVALILGIPFKWIIYKGEIDMSVFQIFNYGFNNLFFDLSTLAINTLILFGILSLFEKVWKSMVRSHD
ncbi:hypothetical protein ACQKMD_10240 [Viridibacillus sp. NPDC096237]|uniref:hypothetical protein n=1 Tax=Viridibacillus sp. NPDC096237 TaxID=3390721 RepID=UPI003D048B71